MPGKLVPRMYRAIITVPGVRLIYVAGVIGKLPVGALGLLLILRTREMTGSYAAGGLVADPQPVRAHAAPERRAHEVLQLGRQYVGPSDGGGVHAALVGTRQQQPAHVVRGADAAADRKRQEHAGGGARDDVEDGVAVLVAGGDVEEGEFVGAGGVVDGGLFDGVAGVTQGDEVHALDDAAVFHIQAGDDSQLEHGTHRQSHAVGCKG